MVVGSLGNMKKILYIILIAQSLLWSEIKIEHQLENGKVKSIISMRDFLAKQGRAADFYNPVFFVILDNGLEGVFKPDSEAEGMFGEIAAYEASKITNLNVVPPTVIRNIQGKKGSFQLYVKNVAVNNFQDAWSKLPAVIKGDCIAFQFVFGQWDTHEGNILFINDHQVMLIDNSGMVQSQQANIEKGVFVRKAYSDKRRDNWDTPFNFDSAKEIAFADIPYNEELKDFDNVSFKFLEVSKKPLVFNVWRNSLWFKPYSDKVFKLEAISKTFFESLKFLNKEQLNKIWKNYPKSWTKARKAEMLNAILNRRDQLLRYIVNNKISIV